MTKIYDLARLKKNKKLKGAAYAYYYFDKNYFNRRLTPTEYKRKKQDTFRILRKELRLREKNNRLKNAVRSIENAAIKNREINKKIYSADLIKWHWKRKFYDKTVRPSTKRRIKKLINNMFNEEDVYDVDSGRYVSPDPYNEIQLIDLENKIYNADEYFYGRPYAKEMKNWYDGDAILTYSDKWFNREMGSEDKLLTDLTPKELNNLIIESDEPYYKHAGVKKILLNGKEIPFDIFKYKNKNKQLRGHYVLCWDREDNSFYVKYVRKGKRYLPAEVIKSKDKKIDFRKRNIFYLYDLGKEINDYELPNDYKKIKLEVTATNKDDKIVTLSNSYNEVDGDEDMESKEKFVPITFGYPWRVMKMIYSDQPFQEKVFDRYNYSDGTVGYKARWQDPK